MSAAASAPAGQSVASRPDRSVWVGASAGTGKTKVLVDRVLRLLLAGVAPERVVCLTFTKAAAAEMENRLFAVLGAWARADATTLAADLITLLEAAPAAEQADRARGLFLRVLDTPGGLKIQTIHSFCETVLGRFPLEARIAPHFEVMDERTAGETLRAARDVVIDAPDADAAAALSEVTARLHEARFDELMAGLAADRTKVAAMAAPEDGAIFRWLGLDPSETVAGALETASMDDAFDGPALRRAAGALAGGSAADQARGEAIAAWLADPDARMGAFASYGEAYLTAAGEVRKTLITQGAAKTAPDAADALAAEAARVAAVRERCLAIRTASASTALATLAEALLAAYDREKGRRGRLDYADLVVRVRRLLDGPDAASWVLFKLDGGIDHLLIDEAQDTSPDQWAVVRTLADDFFSGLGAYDAPPDRPRTVFAVGDPKQSIFSFQGADPDAFEEAREHFRARAEAAGTGWESVALEVSYRSTAPVLRAVDAVFADPEMRAGLGDLPVRHEAHRTGQAGAVVLWPPAEPLVHDRPDPFDPATAAEATELGARRLAEAMAVEIAGWIRDGAPLPSRGRTVRAGDVMVLVRRRTAFVEQLVRALKELRVAVAGIDRLVLSGQLAVMDLVALAEAALLPDDDLTLATVLKGPLFGFDEETLYDLAHGRTDGERVFARLAARAAAGEAPFAEAHAGLSEILAMADFVPPFEFYMRVLASMGGRARILARLGPDAEDPIDEFLALALDYEREHAPSLQGFVAWFRAAATEVKRDLEHAERDEVRVMTVHGAKGLEAPIVILADTMQVPDRTPELLWPDDAAGHPALLWRPSRDDQDRRTAAFRAEADRRRDEEYRRLLYVAMTRAQDQLHVAGYATLRKPPETCWYKAIERALEPIAEAGTMTLDAATITGWSGPSLRLAAPQETDPDRPEPAEAGARAVAAPPDWIDRPAPPEPATTPPAAPSRLDEDATPIRSPLGDDGGAGFRRGRIVHHLLQALPAVAEADRARSLEAWLARPAVGLAPEARGPLAREVLAVLSDPEIAPLFGPGSLAEAPIAGHIGERAFSGRIDRLLVTGSAIDLVDFKTDRAPPGRVEEVAPGYLRQLAAYRALLARLYPDRPVRAALIWTVGPAVMAVPDALLDRHAP